VTLFFLEAGPCQEISMLCCLQFLEREGFLFMNEPEKKSDGSIFSTLSLSLVRNKSTWA